MNQVFLLKGIIIHHFINTKKIFLTQKIFYVFIILLEISLFFIIINHIKIN